mgnify:CR=1 FL=1
MKRLKWVLLIFLALIPIIGIYILNNPKQVIETFVDMGGFNKGDKLPHISGMEVGGNVYNVNQLNNENFILMISKSDCEVCKSAYPTIKELLEKDDTTEFLMVGKGEIDEYENIKIEYNFDFPILIADEKLESQLKMKVFPVFYAIDHNGIIVKRMNGFSEEDFKKLVQAVDHDA